MIIQDLVKENFINREEYDQLAKSIENFNRYFLKQKSFSYNPPTFSRKFRRAIIGISLIGALSASFGGASNIFKSSKTQTVQVISEKNRNIINQKEQVIVKKIEYSSPQEKSFRVKLSEGVIKEIGKPVRFEWTNEGPPLNVCIDIVVRAMEYTGINIPNNINKRFCGSVAPWMIRNGSDNYSILNAKPGMVLFFSGVDSESKQYKHWFHSAVVLDVYPDNPDGSGRIKTAIMSTGSDGFVYKGWGSSLVKDSGNTKVKIVDFNKWLKLREASHNMKIVALLDPYDLINKT